MRPSRLLPILAGISLAQAQTFVQLLQSQPELSLFAQLVAINETLVNSFFASSAAQSILVPNNAAVTKYVAENNIDPTNIQADDLLSLLSYHVLAQNVSSQELSRPGGAVIETRLTDPRYNLLKDGGQVVYGKPDADGVVVESGKNAIVKILSPDLPFDNGLIHIIDGLLTFPVTCSETIKDGGAAELVKIIDSVGLLQTLDTTKGATCFAPEDSAIQLAQPVLQNLTEQQTKDAIMFHTLLDPFYTDDLKDGQKLETALGKGVEITVNIRGSDYYFNGVKAKEVNEIAKNGVAYILEGIMSPEWNGVLPGEEGPSSTSARPTPTPTGRSNETTTEPPTPTPTDDGNAAGVNSVGALVLAAGLAVGMLMNA